MNIHGFTKTTLLDYPGHMAATVFTGYCNLRCPFCHNSDLVLNPDIFPQESEEDILAFLKKRHGILKGVCISGGEPTLQSDLADFIAKIKEIGYLVKLDTNGTHPQVLKSLCEAGLLDYVAMDIKAGRNNYSIAVGEADFDISSVIESVSFLSMGRTDYEFRTTAVKGIHTADDFADIALWLPADCRYYIQNYNDTAGIGDYACCSFSKSELESFLEIAKERIPQSFLRGVD